MQRVQVGFVESCTDSVPGLPVERRNVYQQSVPNSRVLNPVFAATCVLTDTTIDWTPDLTDPDEIADTKGYIDEWCSAFPEHFRLVEIFSAAGFAVVRVEKLWCAHLWNVSLRRGASGLPTDYRPAARRIRTLLDRNGIPVDHEPPALRLTGDRISAAFNWRAGEVGAICRRSSGGYDTVRTPNYPADEDVDAA